MSWFVRATGNAVSTCHAPNEPSAAIGDASTVVVPSGANVDARPPTTNIQSSTTLASPQPIGIGNGVVGGIYDAVEDEGHVWSGAFSDGAVTLAVMGALPDGALAVSSEAALQDGALLVMNTDVAADATATLKMAGTAWTSTDWGIGFRSQSEFAFEIGRAHV